MIDSDSDIKHSTEQTFRLTQNFTKTIIYETLWQLKPFCDLSSEVVYQMEFSTTNPTDTTVTQLRHRPYAFQSDHIASGRH